MTTESYYRGRQFGLEAQHLIPLEIGKSPSADSARELLNSIGFNLEARANKKLLFISDATRDAILAAPDAVQNVFRNANVGFNTHDSRRGGHPGYNDFVIDALNALGILAESRSWDATARERAVFDFLRFVDGINADGFPPVYGTGKDPFLDLWDNFKKLDYSQSGEDYAAVDAFIDSLDMTPIDVGSEYNSQFRYEGIIKLLDEAQNVLPSDVLALFIHRKLWKIGLTDSAVQRRPGLRQPNSKTLGYALGG